MVSQLATPSDTIREVSKCNWLFTVDITRVRWIQDSRGPPTHPPFLFCPNKGDYNWQLYQTRVLISVIIISLSFRMNNISIFSQIKVNTKICKLSDQTTELTFEFYWPRFGNHKLLKKLWFNSKAYMVQKGNGFQFWLFSVIFHKNI